jgi:hypothetical protein
VRMVKPALVESKFPAVHSHTCHSTSETTTLYESVGTDDWQRLCWLLGASVHKIGGLHQYNLSRHHISP